MGTVGFIGGAGRAAAVATRAWGRCPRACSHRGSLAQPRGDGQLARVMVAVGGWQQRRRRHIRRPPTRCTGDTWRRSPSQAGPLRCHNHAPFGQPRCGGGEALSLCAWQRRGVAGGGSVPRQDSVEMGPSHQHVPHLKIAATGAVALARVRVCERVRALGAVAAAVCTRRPLNRRPPPPKPLCTHHVALLTAAVAAAAALCLPLLTVHPHPQLHPPPTPSQHCCRHYHSHHLAAGTPPSQPRLWSCWQGWWPPHRCC